MKPKEVLPGKHPPISPTTTNQHPQLHHPNKEQSLNTTEDSTQKNRQEKEMQETKKEQKRNQHIIRRKGSLLRSKNRKTSHQSTVKKRIIEQTMMMPLAPNFSLSKEFGQVQIELRIREIITLNMLANIEQSDSDQSDLELDSDCEREAQKQRAIYLLKIASKQSLSSELPIPKDLAQGQKDCSEQNKLNRDGRSQDLPQEMAKKNEKMLENSKVIKANTKIQSKGGHPEEKKEDHSVQKEDNNAPRQKKVDLLQKVDNSPSKQDHPPEKKQQKHHIGPDVSINSVITKNTKEQSAIAGNEHQKQSACKEKIKQKSHHLVDQKQKECSAADIPSWVTKEKREIQMVDPKVQNFSQQRSNAIQTSSNQKLVLSPSKSMSYEERLQDEPQDNCQNQVFREQENNPALFSQEYHNLFPHLQQFSSYLAPEVFINPFQSMQFQIPYTSPFYEVEESSQNEQNSTNQSEAQGLDNNQPTIQQSPLEVNERVNETPLTNSECGAHGFNQLQSYRLQFFDHGQERGQKEEARPSSNLGESQYNNSRSNNEGNLISSINSNSPIYNSEQRVRKVPNDQHQAVRERMLRGRSKCENGENDDVRVVPVIIHEQSAFVREQPIPKDNSRRQSGYPNDEEDPINIQLLSAMCENMSVECQYSANENNPDPPNISHREETSLFRNSHLGYFNPADLFMEQRKQPESLFKLPEQEDYQTRMRREYLESREKKKNQRGVIRIY